MRKMKQMKILGVFYFFSLVCYAGYSQEYYDDEFYAYEEDYEDDYEDEWYDDDEYDNDIADYYNFEIDYGPVIWARPVYNPYSRRYQSGYFYSNNFLYILDYNTGRYRRANRAVGISLVFNDFNSPFFNRRGYYAPYFPDFLDAGRGFNLNFINNGPFISFNFFNRRARGWGWQPWNNGRYYRYGTFGRFNRFNRYNNRSNGWPYGWGWQNQNERPRQVRITPAGQRANSIASSNPRVRRSNDYRENGLAGGESSQPRANRRSNQRTELRSATDRTWQAAKQSGRHHIDKGSKADERINSRERRSGAEANRQAIERKREARQKDDRRRSPKNIRSTYRTRQTYNTNKVGRKGNSISKMTKESRNGRSEYDQSRSSRQQRRESSQSHGTRPNRQNSQRQSTQSRSTKPSRRNEKTRMRSSRKQLSRGDSHKSRNSKQKSY